MPAPVAIAPIAWKAAQLGALAAVAWYAGKRQREAGLHEVWRENVLNEVQEGLETGFQRQEDSAQCDAAARFCRTVRVGPKGPGIELDLTGLARLRLRRVRAGD